ncbi:hypothetical protein LCGC14_2546320, partial [marine sediment metagenome]
MLLTTEQIARVCYETNRAYCKVLGGESQVEWDDAPDWQKKSVIDGVKLHLTHPQVSNEQNHKNWLRLKLEQGWGYAPVKNVKKKVHPCFVPYNELSEEQKIKSALFGVVITALQ